MKVYNGYLFAKVNGNLDLSEMKIPEQQYPRFFDRMMEILERDIFPFYKKMTYLGEHHFSHDEAIKGVQDLKNFYINAMYQQFNITTPANRLQEKFNQLFVQFQYFKSIRTRKHSNIHNYFNELDYVYAHITPAPKFKILFFTDIFITDLCHFTIFLDML